MAWMPGCDRNPSGSGNHAVSQSLMMEVQSPLMSYANASTRPSECRNASRRPSWSYKVRVTLGAPLPFRSRLTIGSVTEIERTASDEPLGSASENGRYENEVSSSEAVVPSSNTDDETTNGRIMEYPDPYTLAIARLESTSPRYRNSDCNVDSDPPSASRVADTNPL